jgi:hypothetical protein
VSLSPLSRENTILMAIVDGSSLMAIVDGSIVDGNVAVIGSGDVAAIYCGRFSVFESESSGKMNKVETLFSD